MKIKYLKVMHNANVGDVLEVTDFEANILIKTGVAEEFKEPVSTFDTIKNYSIKRSNFGLQADRLSAHKALVDQAFATNGWLVITTHVNHELYWDANSATDLTELVNYIKTKGCKILKPRDAFQIFGNIVENDSGFKIAANGKVIGAS